uniref:MARCO like n=1 Tax=Molossus molossus TaxID=27622 RepID=A0A7J8IAB9_MOLMO|nr:MARCO like [Molossus molossus]
MKAFIFFPFVFCAMFSGSSTQTLQTSVIKLEEDPELALTLERKNKANPQGEQTESNKKGDSNTQRKPGIFILGGQPGYSHQPVKLESFNQQGKPGVSNQPGSLQGNSGESNQKGSLEISIEPGKPGSSSQQGKPGSSSQQGKPGSSGQQGESGSSSQQGKPQQGKPGVSNQLESQGNSGESNQKSGGASSKKPTITTRCHSIYKPVCGSDGKTYGNRCIFDEAKRLSNENLSLRHNGKC